MNNIIETIKKNTLLQLALVGVAIYIYFNYMKKETLENDSAPEEVAPEEVAPEEVAQVQTQVPINEQSVGAKFEASPQLIADDLLPKYDESNEFAKQNPVSNLLKEQNFMISGYHSGINTVISSNKMAYHDLRSMPPVPKDTSLSVWNISSYDEPVGSGRKQLEIGV